MNDVLSPSEFIGILAVIGGCAFALGCIAGGVWTRLKSRPRPLPRPTVIRPM